jgi:cystathionine beta-lyase/cystathionine gamma-synthase
MSGREQRREDAAVAERRGAELSLETLVVHAGNHGPEEGPHRPTVAPVYLSNSFQPEDPERMDAILGSVERGYTYTRHANPSAEALAEAVAVLEGGAVGVPFASGMAAVDAALYAAGLEAGDTLLLSRDLYGASINLAEQVWGRAGLHVVAADLTDLNAAEEALARTRPKAVLFELVSNPLLRIVDGPAVTALAHRFGAQVIVDNTFTTPLAVRPLMFGADLVVHSATKYLAGHGDATGGVVVAPERYAAPLHQYLKLRGAVLGPFEAWLIHRGLRTLALRFRRQVDNARELARRFQADGPFVAVHYPGLPSHPHYERAQRLLGPWVGGAVVTVELPGGRETVYRFFRALKLVASATTVGDLFTLCLYPPMASHRQQSPAERAAMGITEGTVRISVGIEDVEDIWHDLTAAARQATGGGGRESEKA